MQTERDEFNNGSWYGILDRDMKKCPCLSEKERKDEKAFYDMAEHNIVLPHTRIKPDEIFEVLMARAGLVAR